MPEYDTSHSTENKKDIPEFLERIYQVYWKNTGADSQAPENVWMINMTFIGQSTPDIRRKHQCLDWALGMNPSQWGGIAFKIYHAWETRKLKQGMLSLETMQRNQKNR